MAQIFLWASPLQADFTAKVLRVIDGDTLVVEMRGGLPVTLRLWGVDAPEKKQAYGPQAASFVRGYVGAKVKVKYRGEGAFGRKAAQVRVDGRDLGLTLIERGLAWHSPKHAPEVKRYRKAQEKADRECRGLWAGPDNTPPWEWREGGFHYVPAWLIMK